MKEFLTSTLGQPASISVRWVMQPAKHWALQGDGLCLGLIIHIIDVWL